MGKGLPRSMKRAAPLRDEIIKQVVRIKDLTVNVAAASTAVGFGTAVIGGLPQGNLLLLGAVAYLSLTTADTDAAAPWHGDFGIGTAPTADADLGDAEDDNIIPSTTIDAAGSTRTSATVRATSTTTEQGAIIDNTDGSKELNLNVLVDAADMADDSAAAFTANGYVVIAYIPLGDD